MAKCEFCDNEQKYSYSDDKNGLGKYDPLFTGGLLPVGICGDCLLQHVSKFWPGSTTHKALLKKKRIK